MGTGIYKTKIVKGEKVKTELKQSEVKKFIMDVNKWDTETYQKEYWKIRNKLRSYEAFRRSSGIIEDPQSVAEFLYKEAKSKKAYGKDYKPSIKSRTIRRFTSISSGKKLQQALKGKRYKEARELIIAEGLSERFAGLIAANDKAREIAEAIDDPVIREQALTDFANTLHEKLRHGRSGEAIPTGETYGSDNFADFDYSIYLDE